MDRQRWRIAPGTRVQPFLVHGLVEAITQSLLLKSMAGEFERATILTDRPNCCIRDP